MNATYAENFIRSANAPAMSAGVMTANIIWNATNASVGTVPVACVREARAGPTYVEPADEPAVRGPERERVADERPLRRVTIGIAANECISVDEHVLAADHAAVEERQRRAS